jgi:hypothetical protein
VKFYGGVKHLMYPGPGSLGIAELSLTRSGQSFRGVTWSIICFITLVPKYAIAISPDIR